MITIKKKHNGVFNDIKMIKQFSSVVRFAFNRRKDNDDKLKTIDIERIVKSKMNNIDTLDASWVKEAVKLSFELNIENKLHFGSKYQCKQSKYKKVNKYKESRFIPLNMRGETSKERHGNRKAILNIIDNNSILFKPKKGIEYKIKLCLSKEEKRILSLLQLQCKNGLNYFNIRIDLDYVYISYNIERLIKYENIDKEKRIIIKDRVLGLDLNHNYIAITINDFKDNKHKKIIHKELFCLQKLNLKVNNKNKKDYELVQIAKQIINLALHYQIESVAIENLNIYSKNHGKGKSLNRLLNNNWNRNLFVNNLTKRANLNDINIRLIRPEFSSFIGQMRFPKEFDSVAASIEVGYRGYLIGRTLNEYDSINDIVDISLLPTQWKKMVMKDDCSYRDLYNLFKEKKLLNSYRFLFDYQRYIVDNRSCLRLKSYRSNVDLYKF